MQSSSARASQRSRSKRSDARRPPRHRDPQPPLDTDVSEILAQLRR
jgi:hypothetical protein